MRKDMETINTEHVEMLTQVYEALDTVQDDLMKIRGAADELLSEEGITEEQKLIVHEELSKDRAMILPRRAYALGSLIGLELSRADVRRARSQYLQNSEETSRTDSVKRLIEHEARIRYARETGEANTNKQLHDIATISARSGSLTARIVKSRTDAEGHKWVSLCDPNVVEVSPGPDDKRVICSYGVGSIDQDADTGLVTAQLNTNNGTMMVRYQPGEHSPWELSEDGQKLSLVRRLSHHGLLDAAVSDLEGILTWVGDNQTREVAIAAAGANVPHIINSFEYPAGVNPKPLNVPKTN